jgi:NADH-quinone oxidoreductase subunit M
MLFYIVFIPLVASAALWAMDKDSTGSVRNIALSGAGLCFLFSLFLLFGFEPENNGMQFVAGVTWVESLNIHLKFGIDGISLWLVILTSFLGVISVLYSSNQVNAKQRQFLALLLALEAGILGVFVSLDTISFYVFWELMLLPSYFIIGLWGEGDRIYATTKFVLFTLVGSLLMLVAILALSMEYHTVTHEWNFDIDTLSRMHLSDGTQLWMFLCFFLAFAIKVPMFPLHSWLPHAYKSCPIAALILITGAMSKAGTYGMIRFCVPLFPSAIETLGLIIGACAAGGMVYGAWIAVMQKDLKSLVAYSSISHLGFIVLGIFSYNSQGVEGSVLQMVNHGIIASALFIIVGIIEEKMGTRQLDKLKGMGTPMPILYGMFMLLALAALGLPGLNGFVGEFLILAGVWTSVTLSAMAAIFVLMGGAAIVFASIYMLYMFQGAMQEKNEDLPKDLQDVNCAQFAVLLPACILVVFIGLYPKPFIDRIGPSVDNALHAVKTVNVHTGESTSHH